MHYAVPLAVFWFLAFVTVTVCWLTIGHVPNDPLPKLADVPDAPKSVERSPSPDPLPPPIRKWFFHGYQPTISWCNMVDFCRILEDYKIPYHLFGKTWTHWKMYRTLPTKETAISLAIGNRDETLFETIRETVVQHGFVQTTPFTWVRQGGNTVSVHVLQSLQFHKPLQATLFHTRGSLRVPDTDETWTTHVNLSECESTEEQEFIESKMSCLYERRNFILKLEPCPRDPHACRWNLYHKDRTYTYGPTIELEDRLHNIKGFEIEQGDAYVYVCTGDNTVWKYLLPSWLSALHLYWGVYLQ